MWNFFQKVRSNPIYLREQGRWGEPNQYFATLMRYLPLIIIVVLGVSIFCGSYQLTQLLGIGEAGGILFLLLCLPNIVIQVLTWIGIVLAPALTAPSVVEEMDRGSWDILRLTPMSTIEIIVSKFFGSLSRLRIWRALMVLSVLYAVVVGLGTTALGSAASLITGSASGLTQTTGWQTVGVAVLTTASTILRPWLEIGFAGLIGLTLSLWTNSARAALIGSYAVIMVYRMIINTIVWTLVVVLFIEYEFEAMAFGAGAFSLNIVYFISGGLLFWLLRRRALAIDNGELLHDFAD